MDKPFCLYPDIAAFLDQLKAEHAVPVYKLTYADARRSFDAMQRQQFTRAEVDITAHTVPLAAGTDLILRVYRPTAAASKNLPGIVYFHGGGWVLGGHQTHDRLMKELAVAADVAIVFVEYALAPEARFPTQIEQGYVALSHTAEHGPTYGIDERRLGVAGDSAGGYLAAVVAQLAVRRGGPHLAFQALFYPVVDASMRYASYEEFAAGPWLTTCAMQWFWDAYAPHQSDRRSVLIAPVEESSNILSRLPPSLIIVAENDVLRDEGERYGRRLIAAGVEATVVRVLGTCHDFVLLDPIAQTPGARSAIRFFATEARAVFDAVQTEAR